VHALQSATVETCVDHGAQRRHARAPADEDLFALAWLHGEVAERAAETDNIPWRQRIEVGGSFARGVPLLVGPPGAKARKQGQSPIGLLDRERQ
jgi:hypothetical protein